jgi:hypothetical protein
MKIAVVGSREFKDERLIFDILSSELTPGDILVSGGARGVDTFAEESLEAINSGYCSDGQITKKIFKPDWDKYGKRAGFLRNELIINEADKVIAFWNGESKGTKHSIDLAIKAGKPIDIYVRK